MQESIEEILEIEPEDEVKISGRQSGRSKTLAEVSFGIAIFSLVSAGLSIYRISEDSAWVSTPEFLVPIFQMADYFSLGLPLLSFILGILALISRNWDPEAGGRKFAIIGIIISLLLYPIYWLIVIRLALENMW